MNPIDGQYQFWYYAEKLINSGFLIDAHYSGDAYLQSAMRLQSNGRSIEERLPDENTTTAGITSQGVNVNTGLWIRLNWPTTYWEQFCGNILIYLWYNEHALRDESDLDIARQMVLQKPLSESQAQIRSAVLTMYASCTIIFRIWHKIYILYWQWQV